MFIYKKSFFKIITLAGVVFSFSFFIFNISFANFTQSVAATSTPLGGRTMNQFLGSFESGQTINSFSITQTVPTAYTLANLSLLTCFGGTFTNPGQVCSSGNIGQLQSLNNFFATSTVPTVYTFSFSLATTTNIANDYILSSGGLMGYIWGSNNPNSWPTGNANFSDVEDYNIKDIYFELGTNITPGGAFSSNISLLNPEDEEVLNNNLFDWVVEYSFSTTTLAYQGSFDPRIIVYMGTSLSSALAKNKAHDFGPANSGGTFTPFYSSSGDALTQGDWYAFASIEAYDETNLRFYTIDSSSVNQFTITGIFTEIPTPSASSTFPTPEPISDTCEIQVIFSAGVFSCIRELIVDVADFLFFPHQTTLDLLTDNLDLFKFVFPFNIFFDFQQTAIAALNNNASSTSLTSTFVLRTPRGNANIDILTPTMLEDTIGTTTTNKLFEIETNLIWLGTGLAILALFL